MDRQHLYITSAWNWVWAGASGLLVLLMLALPYPINLLPFALFALLTVILIITSRRRVETRVLSPAQLASFRRLQIALLLGAGVALALVVVVAYQSGGASLGLTWLSVALPPLVLLMIVVFVASAARVGLTTTNRLAIMMTVTIVSAIVATIATMFWAVPFFYAYLLVVSLLSLAVGLGMILREARVRPS